MGRPIKKATDREKAIVFALAGGIIPDTKTAYLLSRDAPVDYNRDSIALPSIATRWRQREDIARLYEEFTRYFIDRDAKQRAIGREEERARLEQESNQSNPDEPGQRARGNVRTKGQENPLFVDYSNPVNQSRKLNEIINKAGDAGEALDALKVIISTQRADRDAAKDNKVVRAYLPHNCHACPLYHAAHEKGGGVSSQ
jgi:hypothetical protein